MTYYIQKCQHWTALFQRLGRCYRSRKYEGEEPNVRIYTEEASGVGYVYDKEIYINSIKLLEKYDNQILGEKTKIDLVDKLYSKETLKDTNFYELFKKIFLNFRKYN